eukprot:2848887-Prymnesium_polylepis.1
MQATREQCWAALPSGFRRWCTTVWGGSRDKLYKAIPASLWSNGCFGCVCSCVVRDRERRIRLYRQLQEEEEMQSLATKRGGLMQRCVAASAIVLLCGGGREQWSVAVRGGEWRRRG